MMWLFSKLIFHDSRNDNTIYSFLELNCNNVSFEEKEQ